MAFLEILFNYAIKLETSKKATFFVLAMGLVFPSLAYLIHYDNALFKELDFLKVLLMSIVLNFEMVLLISALIFIPWCLIVILKLKLQKRNETILTEAETRIKELLARKVVEQNIPVEENNTGIHLENVQISWLKSSSFNFVIYPLLIICIFFCLETVIIIVSPGNVSTETITLVFGKINNYSISICIYVLVFLLTETLSKHHDHKKRINKILKDTKENKYVA